jgi:hypothetical protein
VFIPVHTGDDHSHLLEGQSLERLALVPRFYAMIHANMGDPIRSLWTTPWHAMDAWCLVAPLCASMLYMILLPALRRVARRKISVPEAA